MSNKKQTPKKKVTKKIIKKVIKKKAAPKKEESANKKPAIRISESVMEAPPPKRSFGEDDGIKTTADLRQSATEGFERKIEEMGKPPLDTPALHLHGIKKRFEQGSKILNILRGATISIGQGEIVALLGPSGTGKSTLLQIAGLLEKPDSGEVNIYGNTCKHMRDTERSKLRCSHVGFVYQNHNLLPDFTALDNVLIPQMIHGKITEENQSRAEWLLEKVGLKDRIDHLPSEMSGGEQQRVAIIRALANKPKILLADEPTGNLDPHTSKKVFGELMNLVRDTGLSAFIATHNPELANQMDRRVSLKGGVLVELEHGEELY